MKVDFHCEANWFIGPHLLNLIKIVGSDSRWCFLEYFWHNCASIIVVASLATCLIQILDQKEDEHVHKIDANVS